MRIASDQRNLHLGIIVLCALTLSLFDAPEVAAQVVVNNGEDYDPDTQQPVTGTFRWAVEVKFQNDPATSISVQVGTVTLTSPVEYGTSGSPAQKKLVITSTSGTTIQPPSGQADYLLDIWTEYGVELSDLSFNDSGIRIRIPDTQTAGTTISVYMDNVNASGSGESGLRIEDSSAGFLDLSIDGCDFSDNDRWGAIAFKAGSGSSTRDLYAIVTSSDFHDNGSTNPDPKADGLQLFQSGNGSIYAYIGDCIFGYNREDAFDIDEGGDGNLIAIVDNVESYHSGEENMDITENGNGDLTITVTDCLVYGGFGQEFENRGMDFQEEGAGEVDITIQSCDLDAHEEDGIRLRADQSGTVNITIEDCYIENTYSGDGIDFQPESLATYAAQTNISIFDCFLEYNITGIVAVAKQGYGGTLDIDGPDIADYEGNVTNLELSTPHGFTTLDNFADDL